jgi:NADH-quinone oxidoreductase subunit N
MPFQAPSVAWHGLAPELALVGGALVALLIDAMRPSVDRRFLAGWSLATIGLAAWFTFDLHDTRAVIMQGAVVVDGVALFGRMILLMTAAMTVLISFHYLSRRRIHRGEYYPLLLLATSGMTLLAAANDLLLVFLSIEILSLALYIMVAFARRDDKSQEGALKYFLLGAFSSAFLLYGIALTYGATGSTQLSVISQRAAAPSVDARLMFVAVALIGAGFAFKVAAVPFHMWTPDAYQGAPTSVTGFMAAGTKAAAFIGFFRVFLVGFGSLQWDWRPVLWILAVATMSIGSILAIAQTDVKRMLAYSSIAHAGYVLIGLVAANRDGVSAALFYLFMYALVVLGAFAAVIVSSPSGERLSLSQWGGVGRRHPVFGGAMTLFLLALAGVPPTAGFAGKFLLFAAAIKGHETALVVAATATTVIAAFFYLRLVVLIWLQEPAFDEPPVAIGATPAVSIGLGLAAAGTLAFGVWPQSLIDLARNAISHGFVG